MADPAIMAYYGHGLEQERLSAGRRRIEFLRTWELLGRWLPPAPAVILDVGGGAGVYAFPLAAAGYQVHLVDPVPLHIEQATEAARDAAAPLASATVGDARALAAGAETADAVLLLGPLYHLTSRADRLQALREARRVLRPGGIAVTATLSRLYALFEELAGDPVAAAGDAAAFLADGRYENPAGDPAQFTTAYFHRPEEIAGEIREAGLEMRAMTGGSSFLQLVMPGLGERMEHRQQREAILSVLRLLEDEPSILGLNQHLITVAERPPGRSRGGRPG